ncbi:family 43 glycosylhydrolase [Pedobacter sp. HMF7647]|uniref:Family 43 glycosylhydrolase n=1 Tax=Hufsiella arboris TaxID=2695275 RepID=A0A7K1Y8T3_9SPHI|nr:family 43 glycosylhydrolase [Hufsiella arboris]MXV51004.1 family 43 glycosylhydrolase [Hufsiella arboris]
MKLKSSTILLLGLLCAFCSKAQEHKAASPLFRDPIYDGAADPVVVYNQQEKSWWMMYTQRRANVQSDDVAFCYGTKIGVAVSKDNGQSFVYKGALELEFETGQNTFWAPEVIYDNGTYHMFVAYIEGVRNHWGGQAHIIHYTSKDLWKWIYKGRLKLSSDDVIDATVCKLPHGKWHIWYKDSTRGSITMTAESADLTNWVLQKEPAIAGNPHEGPKVFFFNDWYWMITDEWKGQRVYRSKDAKNWVKQGMVLDVPGHRPEDTPTGAHADVVVTGNKAYIFYFTHPGRKVHSEGELDADHTYSYSNKRTSIHVAELEFKNGTLVCDRDKPFDFWLASG